MLTVRACGQRYTTATAPQCGAGGVRLAITAGRGREGSQHHPFADSQHSPAARLDAAVVLGAKNPLSMPDGVRLLLEVIKAVPRLQSFVSNVCKVGRADAP